MSLQMPVKKGAHRALDDIKESIQELKYYRQHIFRDSSDEQSEHNNNDNNTKKHKYLITFGFMQKKKTTKNRKQFLVSTKLLS